MIDRFEDVDKFHSPNYQYQHGRNACKLGLDKTYNPFGNTKPQDDGGLKILLWEAWNDGYEFQQKIDTCPKKENEV